MRSTQSLFRGIFTTNLGGKFPYFCWLFCTLAYATGLDFPMDGSSNAWTVQMLTNYCLRYIQYRMKEIRVVPFHHLSPELLWNNYVILVPYKFYSILASVKITLFIFLHISFSCRQGSSCWYQYINFKDKGKFRLDSSSMS